MAIKQICDLLLVGFLLRVIPLAAEGLPIELDSGQLVHLEIKDIYFFETNPNEYSVKISTEIQNPEEWKIAFNGFTANDQIIWKFTCETKPWSEDEQVRKK